jgi:Flp pilus assembly protein TadG
MGLYCEACEPELACASAVSAERSPVEFALVFPVVIGLMFATIDAGRFIATRTMLAQAAAAAARTACLSSTTAANNRQPFRRERRMQLRR